MQLHDFHPNHPFKRKKTRVGRGGKRGTTSGRGTKGQRSRAGHRIRPAERDFIQRLPKLRGVKNKSLIHRSKVIRTSELGGFGEKIITREVLTSLGKINNIREAVKILYDGEVRSALRIQGIPASAAAKKAIEAAGGKIE